MTVQKFVWAHVDSPNQTRIRLSERQPGDLGVLRGVAGGVAEEARTRGFASLGSPRVAFSNNLNYADECSLSIRTWSAVRTTLLEIQSRDLFELRQSA